MSDTEHFTRQLTNRELREYLSEMPEDADLVAEKARREI